MNDSTYELYCEVLYHEDIGEYKSYGIKSKKESIKISDVTTSLKRGLEILRILNDNQVSVIHLKDVISDLL